MFKNLSDAFFKLLYNALLLSRQQIPAGPDVPEWVVWNFRTWPAMVTTRVVNSRRGGQWEYTYYLN